MIRACKKNDIYFLGLFGSYARGEQKEDRDVDFLQALIIDFSLVSSISR
ncbi:MAG: Nucleotidyltransferase domain protein [Candidatus Methanoperedens nitroreducens]|uniref:Nucleotidyltransferase domain protein n=1 Tax=Candidatus Methanoperedens nitratireducens TaxID=1392998 RepID=A0A0P8AC12_9EURY|nr:MAG: Nucleotidyltransferase domain protein [Candidatus Methanoperedens sp. BLZ1]